MKNKDFFDHGHAQRYLQHSIIRVKGEPVWVEEVTNTHRGMQIVYCGLDEIGLDSKTIPIKSEDVDMNPVPLGFCNISLDGNPMAVYCSRAPVRAWKIGLSGENFDARGLNDERVSARVKGITMPSKFLAKTIMGRYPALDRILINFRKYNGSAAFSRRFAIDRGFGLWYAGIKNPVGAILRNIPKLSDNYFFLKEVLEEDLARAHN